VRGKSCAAARASPSQIFPSSQRPQTRRAGWIGSLLVRYDFMTGDQEFRRNKEIAPDLMFSSCSPVIEGVASQQ
jgi:hypothetical protein